MRKHYPVDEHDDLTVTIHISPDYKVCGGGIIPTKHHCLDNAADGHYEPDGFFAEVEC